MSGSTPEARVVRARIVTVSTRASAGVYDDTAGPAVEAVLAGAGITVLGTTVVPDGREGVSRAIIDACRDADVVITNGGTGMHPKDTTPEAMLSRGIAGIRDRTLVVNVPGSPKGARESVEVVVGVLGHAVDQLAAGDH